MIKPLIMSKHNAMKEKLKQVADDIITNNKTFVIWGCGNTGRRTYDFLREYSDSRLEPLYFVDNNKSYWGNNNVVGPDTFEQEMNNIDVVLVGVYVADQVHDQLIQMGYTGQIIWSSMSVALVDEATIQFYNDNLERIRKVYDLLDDEKSRKTVEAYLQFIQSGDIEVWKNTNGNSIYKLVDDEVLNFDSKQNYVDIGAFVGDTLHAFLTCTKGKYNSILCIEPDRKNFSQLEAYVSDNSVRNATLINAGAGMESGELSFVSNCSESCCLSDDGNEKIRVVALDDIEEAAQASYIKISTNGYDLNALKGAKNIIKRNKPQIATYSSGEQLWTIPLYLKSIVPEYKIYYRHYGIGRQAMICYAKIPNK